MRMMTVMIMTVQSSLKWRAALLRGRKRRSRPSLTDEDVSFLTTNTLFSEVDIRSACHCGNALLPKSMSTYDMFCLLKLQRMVERVHHGLSRRNVDEGEGSGNADFHTSEVEVILSS